MEIRDWRLETMNLQSSSLSSLKNEEFDAKTQRCKGLKEKGDKNEKR
jgi:hypothetical protein